MEEKERRAKQDELVEDQTLDGLGRLSVSTSASSRDEGFFDAEEGDSFEDIDLSTRDGNGGRSTGGVEVSCPLFMALIALQLTYLTDRSLG